MKKVLLIMMLGIILMSNLVFATVDEGDTITQQQLDSIDTTTFNLQCQLEDVGDNHLMFENGRWVWKREVSCLSKKPLESGDYEIIRKSHYPYFLASRYVACRSIHTKAECNSMFSNRLIDIYREEKENIREYLRSKQTKDTDMSDFIDNFNV